MPTQRRNDEQIGLQETDFQKRYEPNFSWKSAVSNLLALPALRACWPFSCADYQAAQRGIDVSGQGNHLTANAAIGTPRWGFENLVPYVFVDATGSQYLSRADGGAANWADILGSETYIQTGQRGLSFGGWVWWTALPSALQYLFAKDDAGANRQYYIRLSATNFPLMTVWPGPVTVTAASTIVAGWNHIVGMYDSGNQDLHIQLNGTITSNLGAAPAALADTGAAFTIGSSAFPASYATARFSMSFLCASFIGTSVAQALYQQQRSMFNV